MKDEILSGLQRLLCLSLDRQPASELVPGTVHAWLDALTLNRVWDRERDTPRIREAFVRMSAQIRRWPQPVDLLAAMSAAPVQKKLAPPHDPERAAEAFTNIKNMLRGGVSG